MLRLQFPDFGCDAEGPLASHKDPAHVIARWIRGCAAKLDYLAVSENHSQLQDVIDRSSIFQAMRAPAILGDIATDGARTLARWVRGIKESLD